MDRAAVILVENDELILIERIREGRTYYLFPGGGVEAGETLEQAAVRESREELGLDVSIGRLVAVITHDGNHQHHYLATVVGGEFGTGDGLELHWTVDSPEGGYRPVRLPLATLGSYDIRPRALVDWICSGRLSGGVPILYAED